MTVQIDLEEIKNQTCFAPLAVVGYCYTRSGLLRPLWSELEVAMKAYEHTVTEKLQDVLVAIMAGCQNLAQVNTRLRPERALAQSWDRSQFAEQSTLSRTLDALDGEDIDQLRAGNLQLLARHSQLRNHDWKDWLVVDIDPTSLLASKRAEGSQKGWISGRKNRYCRHVLRFTLAGYHENLFSVAYPGNRHGYEYCKPAMKQLLNCWSWSREQREHIIVRSDAELGIDANVSYLLWLRFQILMKGYSGRRTQAWVQRTPVSKWQAAPNREDRWMAPAPGKLRLGRNIQAFLLRWLDTQQKMKHATLLSTLPYPIFTQWELYDGRGAAEVEIRSDKSGLGLHVRRKHSLDAMEAWIVLTDIAHNLLAWLHPWMLTGSRFETFGPKRLVSDLLRIPGQITFENDRLQKVALWKNHPYAKEMRFCLQKLLKNFDLY